MFTGRQYRSYGMLSLAGLFGVVAGMVGIPGCSKKDSGNSTAKSVLPGMDLAMSTETPEQGVDLELSITGNKPVASVVWSVFKVEADGSLVPDGMCVQTELTKSVCTFEKEGDYVARAIIKLVSGTHVATERKFTVKAPDGLRNQDPIIVMKMTAGTKTATVATFKAEEKGDASFPMGSEITFDLSQSRDDASAVTGMSYQVKVGEGAFEAIVGTSFKKSFDSVGIRLVTIRATDEQGNKTEKTFQLYVTCDNSVAELSLNTSAIAVGAGTGAFQGVNWHTYNATGVYSSGGSGASALKYKWDFNGDGLYDTEWIAKPTLDYPVYTNHMNARTVRVKVWDSSCNFVKVAEKSVNFSPSPFPVSYASDNELKAGPKEEGYGYYIQGKVRGTSTNMMSKETANVDSLSADKIGANYMPKRVMCSYAQAKSGLRESEKPLDQGNFHIYGLERYTGRGAVMPGFETDKNPYKTEGLFHGIDLRMNGIPVPANLEKGVPVLYSYTPGSGGLAKPIVTFSTDRVSDNTLERSFTNSQDCSIKFVIEKADDGEPCAPIVVNEQDFQGTFPRRGFVFPARIWGTFSCPELKDKFNETTSIEDGAFFCEEMKIDACVGCCCCCCCCGVPPIPQ